MAASDAKRVIPNRQRRRIRKALNVVSGKVHAAIRSTINIVSDVVPLIIAAQENRLTFRQIHVEPGNVSVQARGCLRIEAKASGIQSITNSRVVDRIPKGGAGKNGQRSRIDARSLTVRRQVSCIDLISSQTSNTRWSTGRTGRI